MAEYIVKETTYPLGTRQEVVCELVRCKDCKHFHKPSCLMAYDGKEWSEDNGFCHVGERRYKCHAV